MVGWGECRKWETTGVWGVGGGGGACGGGRVGRVEVGDRTGRVYKVEIIKGDLDILEIGGGGREVEIHWRLQGGGGGGGAGGGECGKCEDGRGRVWKSERGSIENRDLRGRVESGDGWGGCRRWKCVWGGGPGGRGGGGG